MEEFDSNTITIQDSWLNEEELRVVMVNTLDHNQDGNRTDQAAEYEFTIFVGGKYHSEVFG